MGKHACVTEQGDVRVQLRKSALTIGTIAFLAFSASGAFAAGKPAKKEKAPELPPAKIEDIHVGSVWARAARKGEKTHIFLTIENKGEVPAVLRGGAADVARFSQLVKFSMLGAYLRTEMVGPVPVAPKEKYTFEPGVVGIELRDLKKDIKRGDTLPVTLAFTGGVEIDVEVEVDSHTAVRYPPPGELPPAKAKAH